LKLQVGAKINETKIPFQTCGKRTSEQEMTAEGNQTEMAKATRHTV
jgi:hypothetical protein